MGVQIVKKRLLSLYILFVLMTAGFTGYLIFEGFVDEMDVDATTLFVGSGQTYSTIGTAISAASAGDTIRVLDGTFNENVLINKQLTLIGNGVGNSIINGGGSGDAVRITADSVTLMNFTVMNGGGQGTPNHDSSIELYYSDYVSILNCNGTDSFYGIVLIHSHWNTILNNSFVLNENIGIHLIYSSCSNTIANNICNGNGYSGMRIVDSSINNTIENNIVNSNDDYGIVIINSCDNSIIRNNTCNSSQSTGLSISGSSNCVVTNNSCNSFSSHAIWISSCSNMVVSNNSATQSNYGITIRSSNNCLAENNTCTENGEGFRLDNSAHSNILRNNIIYNNNHGIDIPDSNSNIICENTIFDNSLTAIILEAPSLNNRLYYNNIINNTNQLSDNGINFWNNSQHEGNYWSDYTGLDNGANGRFSGDGIGDTNIPHLGKDYYPFTNMNGWHSLNPPVLVDPGEFNHEGNYSLMWDNNPRVLGYILEEDTSNTFENPEIIYDNSDPNHDIVSRPNGTYYYRIKAYNDYIESGYSNIVDMTVDWIPSIPENLQVTVNPEGNALNISWEQNIIDTTYYQLFYKTSGDWQVIESITQPIHTYLSSRHVSNFP